MKIIYSPPLSWCILNLKRLTWVLNGQKKFWTVNFFVSIFFPILRKNLFAQLSIRRRANLGKTYLIDIVGPQINFVFLTNLIRVLTKVSLFEFWPISFIKLELWIEGFDKTIGKNENWGKWLDIVAVILPEWEIPNWKKHFLLSLRVFQWQVILAGCKIYGIKELEAIELLCLGGLEKK